VYGIWGQPPRKDVGFRKRRADNNTHFTQAVSKMKNDVCWSSYDAAGKIALHYWFTKLFGVPSEHLMLDASQRGLGDQIKLDAALIPQKPSPKVEIIELM